MDQYILFLIALVAILRLEDFFVADARAKSRGDAGVIACDDDRIVDLYSPPASETVKDTQIGIIEFIGNGSVGVIGDGVRRGIIGAVSEGASRG